MRNGNCAFVPDKNGVKTPFIEETKTAAKTAVIEEEGTAMPAKVTMQDIADALGLSRNTVSKAINNTGIIADSTRELILKKAVEMGYRQLAEAGPAGMLFPGAGGNMFQGDTASSGPVNKEKKEIALLTSSMPGNSHFAVTTLDRMQQIFSSCGYSLAIYRLLQEEVETLRLPGSISLDSVAGIFCIELFDYEYCRMLASLGLPLLLIDGPACFNQDPINADMLLMENQAGILSFLKTMSGQGTRTVGYIGDMMHCRSFFERGAACIAGAGYCGYEPVAPYSILSFSPRKEPERASDFIEELYEKLQKLPAFPRVFVCANDFLAISVISTLRRMGIRCPEDVAVLGFDDSPESRFHSPTMSTVHIHTQEMGRIAAEMLLSRIADNTREFRTTCVQTDLILRESTQI